MEGNWEQWKEKETKLLNYKIRIEMIKNKAFIDKDPRQ